MSRLGRHRAFVLAVVSHRTLTSAIGGWHSADREVIREKVRRDAESRQVIVITAGLVLGIVRKTSAGFEVVQ